MGVAGLLVVEISSVLVLGPLAGVVIDRFSRKGVLVAADIGRALLALSLLWPRGAWNGYIVADNLAAFGTFFNPAVQAVIPALSTEDLRLAATIAVAGNASYT